MLDNQNQKRNILHNERGQKTTFFLRLSPKQRTPPNPTNENFMSKLYA